MTILFRLTILSNKDILQEFSKRPFMRKKDLWAGRQYETAPLYCGYICIKRTVQRSNVSKTFRSIPVSSIPIVCKTGRILTKGNAA